MRYSLAESSWGEEEINAMRRVIEADHFTMGEKVKQFETAYAKKFGVYAIFLQKYCICKKISEQTQ